MRAWLAITMVAQILATGAFAQDHHSHTMPDGTVMDMPMDDDPAAMAMDHGMTGVYGDYGMARDASGTSWQPDDAAHAGVHVMHGDWMLMGHGMLTAAYTSQSGPRGDDKGFIAGMLMGMARRDVDNGDVFQLWAMVSPDPFMGPSGYPLLLQAGETADGVNHLTDRQHPHDLVMELSGTYSHVLSNQDRVFVYAGWPGEPAFGPPVFMHRASGMMNPEAPISHHWLDSSHVSFGVLTLGWVRGGWKLDASRFNGREPDEDRFDIESHALNSTAARLSWNPSEHWSLQASWADVKSPEALEPEVDVTKWSASALYSRGPWDLTLALARKDRSDGVVQDAALVEAAFEPAPGWSVFSRAEAVENDELDHGVLHTVSKLSIGAERAWIVRPHLSVSLGGVYSHAMVPDTLEVSYDGDPDGVVVFSRLLVQ
jgi:hypothetical protein